MFASFMINAWIAGTVVAVVSGLVGFFVVLRGSAFAAHAIPNGAFAGAAGANLLGVSPLLGTITFSLAAAWTIGSLTRRSRSDVVTALALVLMLAIGSAFLSLSRSYATVVQSLLFGEILGVTSAQLVPVFVVAVCATAVCAVIYRPLLYASTTPELAAAHGVKVTRLSTLFLVIVALSTALTVPIVGALLSFSLMIGPPAAARLLSSRPRHALTVSVLLAVAITWASLASSYQSGWPIGFFIGTYAAGSYLLARALQFLRRYRRTVTYRRRVVLA